MPATPNNGHGNGSANLSWCRPAAGGPDAGTMSPASDAAPPRRRLLVAGEHPRRMRPRPARPRPAETTVRLSTAKLDALMEVVGELQAARLAAEQRLTELRSLLESAESWEALSRAVRQHTRRLRLEAANTDSGSPTRDENRGALALG